MTDLSTINEWQANRIADWWLDQFSAPTFDNGDRSGGSAFASMMATLSSSETAHPTEAQRDKFREHLVDAMVGQITFHVRPSSDYSPGGFLSAAMDAAGIDRARCPWKSASAADPDGTVRVKRGYGSAWEVISRREDAHDA